MGLKEQRAAALKAAGDIIEKAKAEGRDLSDAEIAEVEKKHAEVVEFDGKIQAAAKSADLVRRIADIGGEQEVETGAKSDEAPTLGDHFVKSVGERGMSELKTVSGAVKAAPEFQVKAATDTHVVPSGTAPLLTQYDRSVVQTFRRPSVLDLFGAGNLGAGTNAVSYLVEGAVEGAFAAVGEGGAKPQLHMADPTMRTDAAKKVAGFMKFSDEMVEDADFLVSEINNRGVYLLEMATEAQVISGSGSGNNVQGILNRSGIQVENGTGGPDAWAEALFKSTTKIQNATGLVADGIVINPADYEAIRLDKDANGQYFGGGYFAGPYGTAGLDLQPPLWGRRTIVSAAVPQGTALVGAFRAAATVYYKGGIRVEATNSHVDDFTNNLVTTRIERRVALACRIPAGFVKVTLAAA